MSFRHYIDLLIRELGRKKRPLRFHEIRFFGLTETPWISTGRKRAYFGSQGVNSQMDEVGDRTLALFPAREEVGVEDLLDGPRADVGPVNGTKIVALALDDLSGIFEAVQERFVAVARCTGIAPQ